MAVAGCLCTGTMSNTGYPDVKPFGLVKGKAFMPLVADDGTRNSIDPFSATLSADILAAVNNADPSKRLYVFNNIQNASAPEADPTYATTDLNERFKTAQGITNVLFEQWGVTEQFYSKVSGQCVSFGEYEIDVCGNLKGQLEGVLLYPRPVNKGSYNAKFQGTTATTPSMVSFNYDYDYATTDGDQWYISYTEFGANNPLNLKGMIDVNLAITVVDATELTVVASFDYGFAGAPKSWTGAELADFTGYSIAGSASITIDSVTETATAGTYVVMITSPATGAATLTAFKAAAGPIVNGYESAATAFTSI